MTTPEVWTRTVPAGVEVCDDGETVDLVQTKAEVTLTPGRSGRVAVDVEVLRWLLAGAGFEREDSDV